MIIRQAYRNAEATASTTQILLDGSEREAATLGGLAEHARIATEHLRAIVGLLSRHFDQRSESIAEPDFLVLPLMAATGTSDQIAAREIAVRLVNGLKMAELFSDDVREVRERVAAGRQNFGKAGRTAFIVELSLVWVDLTGRLPGRTTCQDGPFADFVGTLLGDEGSDLSRQINRALQSMKKADVELVKNEGYLARWRTGADAPE